MSTTALNSLSNKGWVKLLIESVDVPLEHDDSVLLSTVQSLIPGAHGLYYRDGGVRKALNLDTSTGKVINPIGGWDGQDVYVHLAHGHRHGVNCNANGEYTKASEIFERNVSAVQKLIASAGLGYGGLRRTDAKNSPKRSSRLKSGFEAQPEEVHISDESDSFLQQQLEQKKKEVEKLNMEKEELTLRIKDVESELSAQKVENDSLKNTLNDALSQAAPEIIKEEQSASVEKKSRRQRKSKESTPVDAKSEIIEKLQKDVERLTFENTKLTNDLNSIRAQRAGPSMDESGFVDSEEKSENQIVVELEKTRKELDAANKKCATMEAQAESLQTELWSEREQHDYKYASEVPCQESLYQFCMQIHDRVQENHLQLPMIQELMEKEEEMNNLHNVIEELRGKLSAEHKAKEDVEWHLGEHREWLKNAQDKVNCLEAELQRGTTAKSDEVKELENEKAKQSELIWRAEEKISKLNTTITDLQLSLTDAKEKLRSQAPKDDLIAKLTGEKEKLHWKIDELTKFWNDARYKIRDLETDYEQQKELLDSTEDQIERLFEEGSSRRREIPLPSGGVTSTFSIRKQDHSGKWNLTPSAGPDQTNTHPIPSFPGYPPFAYPPMPHYPFYMPMPQYPPYAQNWPQNQMSSAAQHQEEGETRRVLFEIEAPNARNVFLAGSFLNWEAALVCRHLGGGRFGVWVDLPKGKYEFKFMVDGDWRQGNYPCANNEFGSVNNLRYVE